MFLYSIPSWADFQNAFGDNQALIQRVKTSGFPSLPPSPRIILEARLTTVEARTQFCGEVGKRVLTLFQIANPTPGLEEKAKGLAKLVAEVALDQVIDVSFLRLFIKGFIACLYFTRDGRVLSRSDVVKIFSDDQMGFSS
jgi:hypothetical protein